MSPAHSRPQRPRSFWSAPRIATSGQVQRHSGFEWICKHNRLRPEPIRFVRLDSEHAHGYEKSVNRGLPLLDTARGGDSWCWPKGARPLGTRMSPAGKSKGTMKDRVNKQTNKGRVNIYVRACEQAFIYVIQANCTRALHNLKSGFFVLWKGWKEGKQKPSIPASERGGDLANSLVPVLLG